MTYCIYHIPGKKIGVTNNPSERITNQQGYTEDEYDILAMSDDIDYISNLEIELQKQYGYKVDRQLYKNLKPNQQNPTMNINITEQTTTFPCPVNKLKGQLKDSIGMEWETDHGSCTISNKSIDWIMQNVKSSMYNNERCYVYNKAFSKFMDYNGQYDHPDVVTFQGTKTGALKMSGRCAEGPLMQNPAHYDMFDKIRQWASERGIFQSGDPKTQYLKLIEEAGELGRAILKDDQNEVVDAIGDMVVVLTNLAELRNVSIEACIRDAYQVISRRTGKMVNGTFVKDN